MKKTKIFRVLIIAVSLFCVSLQADNFALFPTGGLNGHRSYLLASKFEDKLGIPLHVAFDSFWGSSAGSLPAAFLGLKKMNAQEFLEIYRDTASKAFPTMADFLVEATGNGGFSSLFSGGPIKCLDQDGARRTKFINALSPHLQGFEFTAGAAKNVVILASSNGRPVYYCDPSHLLSQDALRCLPSTPVIDAIVNSCSFSQNLSLGFINAQIALFKNETAELMPDFSTHTVTDGFHMASEHQFGLAHLPVLINYLQERGDNTEHNVVIFDNGSTPTSASQRAKYNINEQGIGKVGNINIFCIYVPVSDAQFQADIIDSSKNAFDRHENEVNAALAGGSQAVFAAAIEAILPSSMEKVEQKLADIPLD